jgi:asparagine synthase (glutamine-hydrolysing)
MCGIVGYWSEKNYSNDMIKMMCDQIKHRGPDAWGAWSDSARGLFLGHRRLSILDLSDAGKQPMTSLCGRYVIIFNGEIYNHLELRSLLNKKWGVINWNGYSDTETLLNCISYIGIDETLKVLNGMFALALFDKKHNEIILARDRVGEKPLYYGYVNKTFFFGSELKAFKCHPSWDGEINQNAVESYLRHNYVPAPLSIYKNIHKLLPGHYLKVKCFGKKTSNPISYWNKETLFNNDKKGVNEDELVDELDRLLKKSVSSRMISDVSLGAFLSGGIDSSTIVALMQSTNIQPVKTFSIGFEQEKYNEAQYAKKVADHLRTDHTELYISSKQALDVIPELSKIYDEPFSDSSQIPTLLVSKLARSKVTVSLSGDGGDELFCGYKRYSRGCKAWNKISILPTPIRLALSKSLRTIPTNRLSLNNHTLFSNIRVNNVFNKIQKLADILEHTQFEDFYQSLISYNNNLKKLLKVNVDDANIFTNLNSSFTMKFPEEMMMYLDFMTYLPDDILVKVDRASMWNSLEVRVPFLDHTVIEYAWSLPLSVKKRNGCDKWILKKVLNKYIPLEIMDRPKMGFGVPLEYWLKGELREWSESLLDVNKLKQQGIFDVSAVRKLWFDYTTGNNQNHHEIWNILMFQAWLENEEER